MLSGRRHLPGSSSSGALLLNWASGSTRAMDGLEESFLVYGLTLEAAKALGTRLEQNAFIWSGEDAVPQLILLR